MRSASPARAATGWSTARAAHSWRYSQEPSDHSTVDLDGCAVDVRSGVGQEKRADASKFVRTAVAAERHRGQRPPLLLLERHAGFLRVDLVEVLQAIGGDAAGNQRVH